MEEFKALGGETRSVVNEGVRGIRRQLGQESRCGRHAVWHPGHTSAAKATLVAVGYLVQDGIWEHDSVGLTWPLGSV